MGCWCSIQGPDRNQSHQKERHPLPGHRSWEKTTRFTARLTGFEALRLLHISWASESKDREGHDDDDDDDDDEH